MKKLIIVITLAVLAQLGYGQTITGTIYDAVFDEPLIGATILEKGTSNGTITDIDGGFSLKATTENPVIEISYIGYETVERTYTGEPISLSLNENANELDEIIVVGYGTQKKKVVTGAIAKVTEEDLEDKQVQRLEQALQGRTAGVKGIQGSGAPGEGSTIRVRGTGSFGGNSSKSNPLYVVDGVIINGGIDYLSANDIESIEVLKDASAAIYGTKGANGVVLVTTKSGTEGIQLNYSTYYGLQRPSRKLALTNATEYGILSNEMSVAAGGPILFDDPQSLGEGTDWQDEVFRNDAPILNHELSLSMGNKKSKYFGSIGYFSHEGIVSEDKSRYQRITARLNSTHDVTSRLKVSTTAAYSRVNSKAVGTNGEFGTPIGRAINMDPITGVYEADPANSINANIYENFPVVSDRNGVFGISPYVSSEVLNPVAALQVLNSNGWSDKLVTSGFVEYEFIEGLKWKSSVGADVAFWGSESFTPVYYLNATNRIDINSYGRAQNRGLTWIQENTLSYEKTIQSHEVQAVIGNSVTKNSGEGIGGGVTDIPVDNIDDASLGFSTDPTSQTFGGFEYDVRNSSLFGRVNYNFAERYLFTAILRRDGSSKFGPNNKFGYFPSVLAGWNVTDEAFFPSNNILNYLKVRGSWGKAGNDNIDTDLFLPTVSTGENYTVGENGELIIGTSPSVLANPDLKWEETTQTSFGFDAKMFKDLSVVFDIYRKDTEGVLSFREVPGFVGFGSPTANVGNVRNEGIELELGYDREFTNFTFDVSANVSYNRNEILFISEGIDFLPGFRYGPPGLEITRFTVGQPIGHLYGYQTDGLFQNQSEVDAYVNAEGEPLQPEAAPGDIRFVDIDGDGDVDVDDRTNIGDGVPTWGFGTSVNVEYKNFAVSIFGQGFAGFDVFNITRRFDLVGSNFSANALERWTGEGTSDDYPRLIQTDPNRNFSRSSDFYIEDGSFFRLRNVQLSYTISEDRLSRFGMGDTKIYVSGNNLYTFTNYSGFDPEIQGGVDRGQYPNPRTFIIGANISLINKKSVSDDEDDKTEF